MGYAGGTTENPTYERIGDYCETVRVEYDPSIVSYQQLLDAFWSGHYPTETPYSSQYRSAIFYTTEEQKAIAIESKNKEQARLPNPIQTSIEPLTRFYSAEDYHQKFYLQQDTRLMREISAIYPNSEDFVNSTAAARLNGYAGGYGDEATLQRQINSLGLSEAGKQELTEIANSGLKAACPVRIPGS